MVSGAETRRGREMWIRIRETVGGSVLVVGVTLGIPRVLLEALRAALEFPGVGAA